MDQENGVRDLSTDESSETSRMLEWALDNYIRPMLMARVGNGTWTEQSALVSFVVDLDAAPTVIRVNDEPDGWTQARAARSFNEGDTMTPNDFIVEKIADAGAPAGRHVSGRFIDGAWVLDVRLGVPHPATQATFDAASEFTDAARTLLVAGHYRALLETAFHAAELLAKCELMSYGPVVEEFASARTHATLRGAYNSWAKLGNADMDSARLLNELDDLRQSATYMRSGLILDDTTASKLLDRVDAMRTRVRDILSAEGPRIVRLIAHRAIEAGEMVGKDDVGIRPQREPRR